MHRASNLEQGSVMRSESGTDTLMKFSARSLAGCPRGFCRWGPL